MYEDDFIGLFIYVRDMNIFMAYSGVSREEEGQMSKVADWTKSRRGTETGARSPTLRVRNSEERGTLSIKLYVTKHVHL